MDGDTVRAEAALQEALSIATDHGYVPVQVQTLCALGELRLRAGDAADAEAMLRRAAALAEAIGMRPDLARARRSLADALRALGRPAEAMAEGDAAAALGLALCPTRVEGHTASNPAPLPTRTEHSP
jgi:tetratricopeptide (TPR) repeat protein